MPKYSIKTSHRFEQDVRRCMKRGLPMEELWKVIGLLLETGMLPPQYKQYKLSGNRAGQWECHIKPDWLLVWEQNDLELHLLFLYTGTHSDLFKK